MSGKEKVKIEIVKGVEGLCIYMNDCRIAGPKPWGGGTVMKAYLIDKEDVKTALKRKAQISM